SLPYNGMVAVWVSRKSEKTQANSVKPPRLLTIDGMAVATIVPSIAVANIASISEPTTMLRLLPRMVAAPSGRCAAPLPGGCPARGAAETAVAGEFVSCGVADLLRWVGLEEWGSSEV